MIGWAFCPSHSKRTNLFFHCHLSQAATAQGFLLVRGATPEPLYCLVSHDAPLCLTKISPIPIPTESSATINPHESGRFFKFHIYSDLYRIYSYSSWRGRHLTPPLHSQKIMQNCLPVSSTWDVDWRAPASSAGSPAPWPSAAPAAASWCSRRMLSGWYLCSSACPWKPPSNRYECILQSFRSTDITKLCLLQRKKIDKRPLSDLGLLWKITGWHLAQPESKLNEATGEDNEAQWGADPKVADMGSGWKLGKWKLHWQRSWSLRSRAVA